eukprot:CAMPEP_0174242930 /NCGR_PEP_ID=MMETSP0417-20130205/29700_1 /TAXON_ID=242541 /ORGANISM="Mayorella sp, Strain BSH-02190019" /LENGTH=241 /DNA_ID=CAMNT_0015322375 /DNA_START=32 /DNA_END=757 /DNA_ORIENTATION=-
MKASTNEQVKDLLKRANELCLLLGEFHELFVGCEDEAAIDKASQLLKVPMCKLVGPIVGDLTKVGEIVYAAGCQDVEVNSAVRGADLKVNGSGDCIEHKVCTYKETKKGGSAITFSACSQNLGKTARRKKLLEDMERKTRGGGVVMEVKNHRGVTTNTFTMSPRYVMEFFARIPLGSSKTYSIMVKRCPSCKVFHRIDKVHHYGQVFDARDGHLSEDEWKSVFKPTRTNCKGVAPVYPEIA